MELLTIEATSRGIFVHQMAGFDPEKVRKNFGVPDGWEAIAAFAIGYPGDAGSLPEPYRSRETAPRSRKPIQVFVMTGHWGRIAPFLQK